MLTPTDAPPTPAYSLDVPEPSLDGRAHDLLDEFLVAVRTHRPLLLALCVLGLAAGGLTGLLRRRTWTSVAQFVPQSSDLGRSRLSGLAAQFGVAVPGADRTQSPDFYAELVKSRDILAQTALARYETTIDGVRRQGTLVELYGEDAGTPAQRLDETLRRMQRWVSTSTGIRTGIVRLEVRSISPDLAAQVAANLVARANQFNLDTKQGQAAAERQFSEQRLATARAELFTAEERLASFLRANRLYEMSPILVMEHDRLQRAVDVRQQVFSSLAQSYEQARIDALRDTPVLSLVEKPAPPVRPDGRGTVVRGLLGLFAGAVVGGMLAVMRHRRAIRSPS